VEAEENVDLRASVDKPLSSVSKRSLSSWSCVPSHHATALTLQQQPTTRLVCLCLIWSSSRVLGIHTFSDSDHFNGWSIVSVTRFESIPKVISEWQGTLLLLLLLLSTPSTNTMSSISFPDSMSSSQGSSHLEDQYYQPSFDTSSFRMNPLSSHPPRTPRVSMVNGHDNAGSSQHYGSASIYEDAPTEVPDEKDIVDVEDVEIDDEEERVQHAEKRILKEEIWREMIVTSNGRDKAFVSLLIIMILDD